MNSGLGTYITYNPLAVSPETRLDELLQMIESLAMHHFPVVDENQQLVGVVSETDLILEARNRMWSKESGDFTTVKDLLTGHLITVDHLAPPRQALKLLMDHYVRSLAVLENGKLVGIVTASMRARLPTSRDPKSASKPSARAPCSVALSSRCDAGTVGAMTRMAASSANTLRSGVLARLSVPTATETPDA